MHTAVVESSRNQAGNRIERKKRQTREQLYDAAVALIASHGYEATTMDGIATEADTARGTAFNHFPSKRDFVLEWAARRRRRANVVALPVARERGSTVDQLRVYFHELATVNVEQFQLTRNMLIGWVRAGGSLEDEQWLAEELVPFLEAGQTQGDLRSTVCAGRCASLLCDTYVGLVLRWVQDPNGPDFDFTAMLDERINMVLYGISVPHGDRHV